MCRSACRYTYIGTQLGLSTLAKFDNGVSQLTLAAVQGLVVSSIQQTQHDHMLMHEQQPQQEFWDKTGKQHACVIVAYDYPALSKKYGLEQQAESGGSLSSISTHKCCTVRHGSYESNTLSTAATNCHISLQCKMRSFKLELQCGC